MDVEAEAAPASGAAAGGGAIDSALYSRQLFVLGHAAQARMQESDVLVVGLRGTGVEIAKNIILMGVKSVTLFDPSPANWFDLSAHCYLKEADVGAPRAERSVAALAALNSYVRVSVLPEAAIDAGVMSRFTVVVAADQAEAEAVRLADLARGAGAKFILAEARGVFGRIFCDLGPSFRVDDVDGEAAVSGIVESVTNAAEGVVRVVDDGRHGLHDGDFVTFTEIDGMAELNGCEPRRVRVLGPSTFSIGDTSALKPFGKPGGRFTQVKQPADVAFRPLPEMLAPLGAAGGPTAADFLTADFGKFDRPAVLHAGFASLHAAAAAKGGEMPTPGDEAAAAAIAMDALRRLLEAPSEALHGVLLQLALGAAGQLSPMASTLGGIAAQEVVKAVSGKFMPIKQWLYIDATECLPPPTEPLPAADVAPAGCRYDGQIAVFGRRMQDALGRLRFFLVGAGAIGCEMLKAWALMGVGCGEGGCVAVTDMDHIEKSNLSRQFLFRSGDIGKPKSVTAVAAAQAMNPGLNAVAYETRVAPDTESIFDDAFWGSLSGVATALDNIDARLYVDGRCVYYGKPLLESGTLGTKGNTQVVVPRLTENYGASRDPPQKTIPVCTLKNFPASIEHTLPWARDWFEGEFKHLPDSVNAYLSHPDFLEELAKRTNERITTLEKLKSALVAERAVTLEDCVKWARLRFEQLFHNNILQLLFAFPPDKLNPTGEPFWSGAKRCPEPLVFSAENPLHLDFIRAATQLRGAVYGLRLTHIHDDAWLKAAAAAVEVPAFSPSGDVKIAASDKELEDMKKKEEEEAAAGGGGGDWSTDSLAAGIVATLPTPRDLAGFKLTAQEFEKDDDLHIALVTAASNLRATNYRIEPADAHTSKLIAGQIVPAIATTTAMVVGLVAFELYKLVAGKPLEAFRNAYANLAVPVFALSEPVAVATHKLPLPEGATFDPPAIPGAASAVEAVPGGGRTWRWSIWDHVPCEGPLSLKAFLDWITATLGCQVQFLMLGSSLLYQPFLAPKPKKERMPKLISVLARDVAKVALPPHARFLDLSVSLMGADGEEIKDAPQVRYRLGAEEIAAIADAAAAAGTVTPRPPAAVLPAAAAGGGVSAGAGAK